MKLFLILYICSFNIFAQPVIPKTHVNIDPKRTIKEVHELAKAEEVFYLKNAKIVIADYDLIKKDFPFTRSLNNFEIDEWLLSQAAYISSPQADQVVVNTEIPVDRESSVLAYRAP